MLMKDEKEINDKLYADSVMDFTTITNCMWILLMDGTLMLDNAAIMMSELLFSRKPTVVMAGIFFLVYAVLSALLILQMLIGVLCDVVSQVGQEQRDADAIGLVKQELLEIIVALDNGDGKISRQEMLTVMKHPKSIAVQKRLNINQLFLLQLQKMLFPRENSTVPIGSVLQLMIMCRGENSSTVRTLSGGFEVIATEMEELKTDLSFFFKQVLDEKYYDSPRLSTQAKINRMIQRLEAGA